MSFDLLVKMIRKRFSGHVAVELKSLYIPGRGAPVSIWFALVLVTLCALLWDVGIVLQKQAVDRMPRLNLGRGISVGLLSLVSSGRWMAGLAASAAGWGLFTLALASTPVSVARAIQGSGFVVLALFSLLFLGHRLSAREWIGVALVTAGIAALGIADSSTAVAQTAGVPPAVHPGVSVPRLLPALAACLLVCVAVFAVPRFLKTSIPLVIPFAITAGTLLGVGDVSTKVLLTVLQQSPQGLQAAAGAAGAGACLVVFYVSGFLVLSRAYQHGRAILVTAVSDLCSRLVAILVGLTALGESLSADPRLRLLAALGYLGILAGALLLAHFSGGEVAEMLSRPKPSQSLEQPVEGKRDPPQVDTDR
jgi:uncharacterized membrane protein